MIKPSNNFRSLCSFRYTMPNHLGSLSWSSLAFVIEGTHLTDGERCSLWLYNRVQYSPMCTQFVMSLIISRSQPTNENNLGLESGKIKVLHRHWQKLVQYLINSLNSPLKKRDRNISLLIDEETEPKKVEATCLASLRPLVTELGRTKQLWTVLSTSCQEHSTSNTKYWNTQTSHIGSLFLVSEIW